MLAKEAQDRMPRVVSLQMQTRMQSVEKPKGIRLDVRTSEDVFVLILFYKKYQNVQYSLSSSIYGGFGRTSYMEVWPCRETFQTAQGTNRMSYHGRLISYVSLGLHRWI